MTAMLNCLIGDIADELTALLPTALVPANDVAFGERVETLRNCGLLDEPGLIALLLRRADEERIATAAAARSGRREARTVQGFVSHENGAVSAAAMALILARGRRRDRFGQCVASLQDLPPASASSLVHAVAATLRSEIIAAHGAATTDSTLCEAARQVIAGLDPARALDTLTANLVRLLDEAGALGDDLLGAAVQEGDAGLIAHVIARRAGLDVVTAFDELTSGVPGRFVAVLRMARVSRPAAAALLAGVGDLLGIDDAPSALRLFDGITDGELEAARNWLAAPAEYRASASKVAKRGKRAL